MIDPFGGADDVRDGVLRVLHEKSLMDDPLRIPRGVRLAARYGYRFDHMTESLVANALGRSR